MRVHLLDGTYELFRSFYGAPSASFAGKEIGATRGFLSSLIALLRESDVSHIGVAFDTVIESFRNDLYAGYKTGDGIEPALLEQFPLVEAGARALGVVVWSMIDFEADDALATFAARAARDARVEQVVLCSPDKDLGQCVDGTRVIMRDRRRGIDYDEAGVVEKFGVSPESIPDYLALVGDSADGIPGIPKFGAKSAGALLARYKHIESIPNDVADWDITVRGAAALSLSLEQSRDEATLYRTLATLRTDVPLNESVDDLAFRPTNVEQFRAFTESIGSPRLFEAASSIFG